MPCRESLTVFQVTKEFWATQVYWNLWVFVNWVMKLWGKPKFLVLSFLLVKISNLSPDFTLFQLSAFFICCVTMFSKATANFVRQIDPEGSLIHVSRVNDSHKLVPMALVVKRNRIWFWQKPKYIPTDFTLSDLLHGDAVLTPGTMCS